MNIDIVSFIIVSIGFTFLSFKLIRLNRKNKVLILELAQALIDKNILSSKFEKMELDKIENTNEFTAFLSQSRNWAFEYIEEVQSKIKDMVEDSEKDIAYFKDFGILTEQYPNYELAKKFVKHYDELIKLLPKEDKDARG